ncbi:hypothetical protein ACFXG4_30340 [Nocardia sp. NPDC059246]|uniref:hypothetical protein n=1 Tax=unclassified Nocardia TaxID=2637762 RepID=UPI00368857C5
MLTADPDISALIHYISASVPSGTGECLITLTCRDGQPELPQAWPLHTDIAPVCFADPAPNETVCILLVCAPARAASALRDTQRLLDYLVDVGTCVTEAIWVPRLDGSFPWTDLLSASLRGGIVHTGTAAIDHQEDRSATARAPQRIPMDHDCPGTADDLDSTLDAPHRRTAPRRTGVLVHTHRGPRHADRHSSR